MRVAREYRSSGLIDTAHTPEFYLQTVASKDAQLLRHEDRQPVKPHCTSGQDQVGGGGTVRVICHAVSPKCGIGLVESTSQPS
ncbi:hypothetical protein D3C72_964840 [compost metagenome]